MHKTYSLHSLVEGRKYLAGLQASTCPNFRAYASYIREAVRKGAYTYDQLGTTESTVLQLALQHAGNTVLQVSRFPLVDLAVMHQLQCELSEVQTAHHRMHADAPNVIPFEVAEAIKHEAA